MTGLLLGEPRRGAAEGVAARYRRDLIVDCRPYISSVTTGEGEGQAQDENGEAEGRVVFHVTTRRRERRLAGLGLTQFQALDVSVEVEPEPLCANEVDARAFANAVIAAAIVEPTVSAADVDRWSERTRAIARVATAEVLDCVAAHERLSGRGMTGDERLLEAMRGRRDKLRASLRATSAALRASIANKLRAA